VRVTQPAEELEELEEEERGVGGDTDVSVV
jgi:hypothetical protein